MQDTFRSIWATSWPGQSGLLIVYSIQTCIHCQYSAVALSRFSIWRFRLLVSTLGPQYNNFISRRNRKFGQSIIFKNRYPPTAARSITATHRAAGQISRTSWPPLTLNIWSMSFKYNTMNSRDGYWMVFCESKSQAYDECWCLVTKEGPQISSSAFRLDNYYYQNNTSPGNIGDT